MRQVQLTEDLYQEALRRASDAGYSSVDDYIAEVVSQDLREDNENFDDRFTPEVIAHLDQISAEIKSGGKTFTMEEVDAHFKNKREEWLRNHPA